MSAYIMNEDEINTIVSYFIDPNNIFDNQLWTLVNGGHNYMTRDNAQLVASKLYAQNVRSVNERYNDETVATYEFEYIPEARKRPAGNIIGALDCLEYQSCETDDWEQTEACQIINDMRKHLLKKLAGDDYTWGIQ